MAIETPGCYMTPPPPPRPRLSPEQRAQVLELRRSNSAADVARITGLPLGTVKALCSRAGIRRDNAIARAFFALPDVVLSEATAVAIPAQLPEPSNATGDADLDSMLWLREVVATGDAGLIAKALEAAERIKTPAKELEQRYGQHLAQKHGNTLIAAFGSMNFADLPLHASNVIDRQTRQREAVARFGSEAAVHADQDTERFCIDTLINLEPGGMFCEYDTDDAVKAFEADAAYRPHTLADCLHELEYWDALYTQRSAWQNSGGDLPQVSARRDYLRRCLSVLRPTSRNEAKAVLRHIAENEMFDLSETDAILENLIG